MFGTATRCSSMVPDNGRYMFDGDVQVSVVQLQLKKYAATFLYAVEYYERGPLVYCDKAWVGRFHRSESSNQLPFDVNSGSRTMFPFTEIVFNARDNLMQHPGSLRYVLTIPSIDTIGKNIP